MHPPKRSYTIWFTQRNGSTLLSRALAQTGIAGMPNEWLNNLKDDSLLAHYETDAASLLPTLWQHGMGKNEVYGQKVSMRSSDMDKWITELTLAYNSTLTQRSIAESVLNRPAMWEQVFPHHRHIFLTRRNKIRQAVSWWKAIQTQEWHREAGQAPTVSSDSLIDKYDFAAIRHLLIETTFREAAIEAFFEEGQIEPLSIVYEDMVRDYEGSIRRVIDFLGLSHAEISIPAPPLSKLADEISEQWVQRFRTELQQGWTHMAW